MKDNKALMELIRFQDLLGEMGFTINGDGTYYKDYGLINGGAARIIPIFDKGISLDTTYRLSAISVSNERLVPIEESGKIPLDQIPSECMSDVTKMIALMAPQSRMPLYESYVITEICTLCGDRVATFFEKDGEIMCLDCFS